MYLEFDIIFTGPRGRPRGPSVSILASSIPRALRRAECRALHGERHEKRVATSTRNVGKRAAMEKGRIPVKYRSIERNRFTEVLYGNCYAGD